MALGLRNMRRLHYGGMLLSRQEIAAANRIMKKNWWPLGEEGKKMEVEAAKYLGVKYGVLANSGSSAGLLALSALELPLGSEVIIPATTFPTIFNIILQCGLVPVVVDSKVGTYNLDPKDVEVAIAKNPKVKAVICVHAVGNPCDMPAIMRIAKKYNVYVLEDNCDGWGGNIGKKKVGSFGHVSFTSFHAAHIVSMGQGGGVFTNDKQLARKARMYRDWGRQADHQDRFNNSAFPTLPKDYDSRFIYEKIGFNISPLELQAAMGRVQLKKTEKIKRLRQKNFNYLYEHLSKFGDLIMPRWLPTADVCWFSFPLTSRTPGTRAKLVRFLEENNVETRSLFSGDITKHPAYEYTEYKVHGSLIQAGVILENSWWITVHPSLTQKELKYIVSVFEKFYAGFK